MSTIKTAIEIDVNASSNAQQSIKTFKEQLKQLKQEAQQAEQQHEMQLLQAKQEFDASEAQKDREARIQEAEIRGAGYSAAVDINKNQQSDYIDNLRIIQGQKEHTDKMSLERDKHLINTRLKETDQQIQRQKIAEEAKRTNAEIQVAKINNKVKENKVYQAMIQFLSRIIYSCLQIDQ